MPDLIKLLVALAIGSACGWLAGNIMKSGHSLVVNIILGIVGGLVGGYIFDLFNLSINGIVGSIISGVVGACVVIFLVRLIKNKCKYVEKGCDAFASQPF